MAEVRIGDLPAADEIRSGTLIPVEQDNGEAQKVTGSVLESYIKSKAGGAGGGVGKSMAGETVWPVETGGSVIAGEGAEIFNNYSERQQGGFSGNVASGDYSHAEGTDTTAIGYAAHAEGNSTVASGNDSHSEGYFSKATGDSSHAEGQESVASGATAHAEGGYTSASGDRSHAEGDYCTASGEASHAEGHQTVAEGQASHSEGYYTKATYEFSHAEGWETESTGQATHAEGYHTLAEGPYSHAEGGETNATGASSHAEGSLTLASGDQSHAEGNDTEASGWNSHAEGYDTVASGGNAHSEGDATVASGDSSHASGIGTVASGYGQFVCGSYNTDLPDGLDYFIVGGGSWDVPANAFRVNQDGTVYGGTYNSSGADYAEYFEWLDGNPDGEDRAGLFVTLDGEKICIADNADDYILGIVSGAPTVIGDSYDDQWHGMYETDVFGRLVFGEYVTPERKKRDGTVVVPARTVIRPKVSEAYRNGEKYIPRSRRPEWAAVGLVGKLVAVDDGTCVVNGYCMPGADGAATASVSRTKYRVIARLDESHVKIMIL